MIETLYNKTADKEALGLLKWLATSHAMDGINSDDELLRVTISSPFLPATNIEEASEKANMDYENALKECQDILDTVDDFVDLVSRRELIFLKITIVPSFHMEKLFPKLMVQEKF